VRVVTAAEMRVIDQEAQRRYGLPEVVLMENAGLRVVEAISDRFGPLPRLRVVVVCGKGSNGGDGFVAARHLMVAGARVRVWLAGDPADMAGAAKANCDIFMRFGGKIDSIPTATPADGEGVRGRAARAASDWPARLADDLAQADVIIDALLGTGAHGAVAGALGEAIAAINASGRPVVAVDLPSGVNADTGAVLGAAVKADLTVTFGAPKPGLLLHPGAALTGELVIADISLPAVLLASAPGGLELLTAEEVAALLPRRAPTAHKGDAGRLLIIAGSRGLTGAAALAAEAAVRAGAGLVTVLTPTSAQPILAAKLTEAMTAAGPETAGGQLAADAVEDALRLAARADAVAVGPGLGVGDGVRALLRCLVATEGVPLVLDADALNVLAGEPGGAAAVVAGARRQVVLTPHPGELARLVGSEVAAVAADRIAAARELAGAGRCCVVLKGAPTVIAAADGTAWLNPTGNPGMASGGMGDALTGAIAALIAQGLTPVEAARAGVFLHGLAGDIAAEEIGDIGLAAGDVAARLPAARRRALAAGETARGE